MERKERKTVFLPKGESLVVVGPDGTQIKITAPQARDRRTILSTDQISERETARIEWGTNFGRTFRQFAASYLTDAGFQVVRSGEADSAEVSMEESKSQLEEALQKAKEVGFSDLQVRRIVGDHSRSILMGETHIGEIPRVVKELKDSIDLTIANIWLPKRLRRD